MWHQVLLSFSSTSTPMSLPTELPSIHSSPSLHLSLGLPLPMCRTLYLSLLNLVMFAWAHLSSLSRFLCMTSLLCILSTAQHCLVVLANLLKVHSTETINCNHLKYIGFKSTRGRARECVSLPSQIISSIISKISMLFTFYDCEMEIVKWLPAPIENPRTEMFCFLVRSFFFFSLGPIVFLLLIMSWTSLYPFVYKKCVKKILALKY